MGARGYGVLDLLFASLYAYLGFFLAPSRSGAFNGVLAGVVALLALAGLTLVIQGDGGRAGRALGMLACAVLLVFCFSVIALLVASSAFLYGVYGALGRGISALSIVAAALVLEGCGLLPLFQLRHHLASRPK